MFEMDNDGPLGLKVNCTPAWWAQKRLHTPQNLLAVLGAALTAAGEKVLAFRGTEWSVEIFGAFDKDDERRISEAVEAVPPLQPQQIGINPLLSELSEIETLLSPYRQGKESSVQAMRRILVRLRSGMPDVVAGSGGA